MNSFLKKILPKRLIEMIRVYRKNKRFSKRFSYNQGKSFFKKITTNGVSFDICINPFINSGVDEEIADKGIWEPELSGCLKKILSGGGVFLDIGANIGYHSLFSAIVLSGKGQVYSFEPQPNIYKQLLQSVEKNNIRNLTVFNAALSDHTGKETLYVREENAGGSTLLSFSGMESFHVDSSINVSLTTLDSYMETFSRVDVIKIDVEGYEYEVFKGGQKVLSTYHPTIFMEFSPVFYVQDYIQKPYELVSFLENLGYSFSTLEGVSLNLNEWIKENDNINSQIDIICKVD